MAGNTPGENTGESPNFEMISKQRGLEDLIRVLAQGEGIDVGDTILAYLGISREVLDKDQEAAIDNLEEEIIDGLNGRLRPGQAKMLSACIEEVKDIHCYTEPAPNEENLQRSLDNLVQMMRGLVRKEGSAIVGIEAELKAVVSLGRTLVLDGAQIRRDGSVGAATEYIQDILGEKDEEKTVIVERILLAELGLFNLLKGLLATQLAKICGAKKEVFRSPEEDILLRQLVLRVIGILCHEGENKAGLIQAEISKVAAAIKSEQTRSRVADVVSGTGAEPTVNLMPRGTVCPAGKRIQGQIGDLTLDEEVPDTDSFEPGQGLSAKELARIAREGTAVNEEIPPDYEGEETLRAFEDKRPTKEDLDAIEGEGEPDIDNLTPPGEEDQEE